MNNLYKISVPKVQRIREQVAQQLNFSFGVTLSPRLAKPFLKWAGGKSQLLTQIEKFLPVEIGTTRCNRYVEPFLGGGAVFFHLVQKFHFREIVLSDINPEIMLVYQVIRLYADELIHQLSALEKKYHILSFSQQEQFFYEIRSKFNAERDSFDFNCIDLNAVRRAVQLIFLNRTCFNGLFRVNRSGKFNVPFGSYKNPTICYSENLQLTSYLLQNTSLYCADFEEIEGLIDAQTFVYLDPPYRPISATSSFNTYSTDVFDDNAQIRLAQFFYRADKTGAKIMLSNSDPSVENKEDKFFDKLYQNFYIHRVSARRAINSNGKKRGEISELLITNYPVD